MISIVKILLDYDQSEIFTLKVYDFTINYVFFKFVDTILDNFQNSKLIFLTYFALFLATYRRLKFSNYILTLTRFMFE